MVGGGNVSSAARIVFASGQARPVTIVQLGNTGTPTATTQPQGQETKHSTDEDVDLQ
jgi:hypothetical protein